MHMSDALLSPAVGGAMWAAAAGTMAYSAAKMRREIDSARVPLMGVLAAFVFAGQMVNFTIPGTGSSGHLGGGIILASLLGPPAAFLAMASILTVQALFFADGGLLALGCNIFNLGFFPAFVAYPLVFRPLAGVNHDPRRLAAASLAASVAGLQLGALGVVLQTVASGISELPFSTFAAFMLPIHLAIGIVEGFVTAAVVSFVSKARPEVLRYAAGDRPLHGLAAGRVLAGLAAATLIAGAGFAQLSSSLPDGLEWSIARVAGTAELEDPGKGVHTRLRGIQGRTAVLPDYRFPGNSPEAAQEGELRPAHSAETPVSTMVGGTLSLLIAGGAALLLRRRSGRGPGKSGT